MKEEITPTDEVWDRFLDLLYPADDSTGLDDIDRELCRAGVDVDSLFDSVNRMVQIQKARAKLASAKEARKSIEQRLHGVVAPRVQDLRQSVRSLIANASRGDEQLAYFHKLEEAASESDLQSLFDDLEKLAALREFSDGD